MAYRLIGKDFTPVDIMAKVTGRAKYAEDFRADRMAFCKTLASPMPHARIRNIDTSAAMKVPGVLAILTAIGVDFSYSSRVSLKLAENLRDETRAEYLARSAVNVSRLLLHFQKQVDQLVQPAVPATQNGEPLPALAGDGDGRRHLSGRLRRDDQVGQAGDAEIEPGRLAGVPRVARGQDPRHPGTA